MRIRDRVELYKGLFKDCRAVEPVRELMESTSWITGDDIEKLEAIRELNTKLSDLYQVSIPVITVWVRDNNYVQATGEIYLTDPELEPFLHLFRHHLQNVERKYERRGLTAEGSIDPEVWKIPYKDTVHKMYGEDDACAWAKCVIEIAQEQ